MSPEVAQIGSARTHQRVSALESNLDGICEPFRL
jgi:hypothetical protein